MGHRANLIIVENREYTLYYTHWGAITITRDLFWGPKHAVNFIRLQREVDESGWLDNIWAEGGAVVDCDNHVLLLYGGEDINCDVPLRRVYLDMLSRVWSPWEVRWTHEGIAEMADYVAYPRDKVLSTIGNDEVTGDLALPEDFDWAFAIGSCRLPDGALRLYPLDDCVHDILLNGPEITAHCDSATGVGSLALRHLPVEGFHIDLGTRQLDYWMGSPAPGVPDRLRTLWSDWSVTWHQDNFEFQILATDHQLCLPVTPKEQLQQRICDWLLRDLWGSSLSARLGLPLQERQRIIRMATGESTTG